LIVDYLDCCSSCGHLVAEHQYNFNIKKRFIENQNARLRAGNNNINSNNDDNEIINHEYFMSCILCGRGEDYSSVINDVKVNTGDVLSSLETPRINNQQHQSTFAIHQIISSVPPPSNVNNSAIIRGAIHHHQQQHGSNNKADSDDEWD